MVAKDVITIMNNMVSTQNDTVLDSLDCGKKAGAVNNRIILVVLGLIISILNFIEVVIIARLRKKKVYEMILLSLSVSDCMFGLSNVIVSSIVVSNSCQFEKLTESSHALYLIFILASIFHLIFIALDKVVLVLKPLQHKVIFTKKKAYIAISVIWITTLVISISLYVGYKVKAENQNVINKETQTVENKSKFTGDMQLLLSVCIVHADALMVVCYSSIIYLTRIKKKKVQSVSEASNRLPIICLCIGATFVICTLPFAIAKFSLGRVVFWADVPLILNSGMNSIVYFFRAKVNKYHFRKKKKELSLSENNLKGTSSTVTNSKTD